jgi:hypothetical protein
VKLRIIALAGSLLILQGCATQTYRARHTTSAELSRIHELNVVSVIEQDKLDAQRNTLSVGVSPVGVVSGAAIAGGLIAGALITAEANHEANVFAEKHVAPLLKALGDFDARATIRGPLQQGVATLPTHMSKWQALNSESKDQDLLPVNSPEGTGWMVLRTRYEMTPDFSGLQVSTLAKLYVAGAASGWRSNPVYSNGFTYQSALLQMPPKTDEVRKQMTDQENARFAALDLAKEIAKVNTSDPYDPEVTRERREIRDQQWQHESRLKQIAAANWNPEERATWFVKQWQADDAAALKADMAEGGQQTARMLALDLAQAQPLAAAKPEWDTVYQDDQRSIQDAPDGRVYSVANGDVTHGATHVSQQIRIATPVGAH